MNTSSNGGNISKDSNRTKAWQWLARYGLAVALVLISGILCVASPAFPTWQNLVIVLRQITINGLLAIGVTGVLLTGGVDLSLGSVVALSGVVAASFAHPGEYPLIAAIAAGVLAGAGCGAINGAIVTFGRVPSFIATLGMMTAARGLALVISGGKPVSNLSADFNRLAADNIAGIPVLVLILAAVAVGAWLFLKWTRLGRYFYAVGGNELAAFASGINVRGVKIVAYTACGALAGLAGLLLASRMTAGQPNAGVAYELDAIAAVVIGGTSLNGGVGGIGGTLLGVLLMGILNNGLDLMQVSSYYQQIIKGAIIIGAVWLDKRQRK